MAVKGFLGRVVGGSNGTFRAERDSLPALAVITVSAVMFAAIFAVHTTTSDVGAGVALFYTLPIALLALRFGMWGGIGAAAVASALFVLWAVQFSTGMSGTGYASRLSTFVLLGAVVGKLGSLLAANEQRFEMALRNIPIAVFNVDRELRYTWYRQTWPNRIGRSVVGLTDRDLLSPEDAERSMAFKRQVIESGEPAAAELQVHDSDGVPRWFSVNAEPIKDPTGHVTGLTAVAVEITEQKKVAGELAGSERRFRSAVENLLEPFALFAALRDENGAIVDFVIEFVNSAAAEMVGAPRDHMVGETVSEVFPGRLESALHDEYVKVVETGQPYFREAVDFINVLGEDTLVRAFDMRVSKLDDGVEVAWRDITDRMRADRSRDWIAAIVTSSADAIVSVRRDGMIESWSAGAVRLYGYAADEVIGQRYTMLFPERDAESRWERFVHVLGGETVGPVEAIELAKDGREMLVSYTASPIRDASGDVVGVARIIREVLDPDARHRLAEPEGVF